MSDMKKIRVGVIGCGSISVMHLDSANGLSQSELLAVCDIKADRAKAAAEKYSANCYTDYKEMLSKEKLDAVHICLPHYLHIPVSKYALERGIHVLCEKPMSIGYTEAEEAAELAEKSGLKYGIIFQCRYNTPSVVLKERITSGKLGKVKNARVTLTWSRSDEYYSHSDWKGTWDKEGGGVIIDQAIHSLDLANWFIDGEIVSVSSTLNNRGHKKVAVEDTADGLAEYKDGTKLFFWAHNNYCIDEPIEIRLVCEKGKAEFSYGYCHIKYSDGTEEYIKNQPQTEIVYGGGKPYWGTQHAVQINNFYNSILGTEELEISAGEALKIQKLITDIYNNNDSSLSVPKHN